jgi:hypothetical protein
VYFSYAQIHSAVSSLVPKVKEFKPDVIIAIGGGGFIPARMLRTEVKVPILAVSLELYDDSTNTKNTTVKKVQWFDETSGVGKQVRTTPPPCAQHAAAVPCMVSVRERDRQPASERIAAGAAAHMCSDLCARPRRAGCRSCL